MIFAAKIVEVIQLVFPITVLLTGLMAGIHFSNLMGYLPALRDVEAGYIIRFWKKADEFFGRRMPIFGMLLLASQVMAIILLRHDANSVSLWMLVFAFVLILADLGIAIKINTPVNKILRTWNGEAIPENFEAMRSQALAAFYGRAAASIVAFLATVAAYALWHSIS